MAGSRTPRVIAAVMAAAQATAPSTAAAAGWMAVATATPAQISTSSAGATLRAAARRAVVAEFAANRPVSLGQTPRPPRSMAAA